MTNALFYVTNHTLHTDFGIQTVAEVAISYNKRFRCRLANYPNPLIFVLDLVNISGNTPTTEEA